MPRIRRPHVRRLPEPAARHTSLVSTAPDPATGDAVEAARDLVGGASRILVLTGAGISTDSGIPDFRGPNGVWTRDPEAEKHSTLSHYLGDESVRRGAWLRRLDNPAWEARPNAGHLALVDLERSGRLSLLVTQNVDGLHQRAGSDPELVVEMHGSIRGVHCVGCGWRGPMGPVLERVRSGDTDPRCERCGGILKSTTVLFGEDLDPGVLSRVAVGAQECDLLLAVGSTLGVYPAAGLVPLALRNRARVVIVNGAPTEWDDMAHSVVRGPISELLPALMT